MSILALGRKQKKKGKFPIKEWEKAKKERRFSINEWEKEKKKENSQSKEGEKAKKRKKIPNQRSEENKINMHKGLWTRQYLNDTELSPNKQEKKGNHDLKWSSPFYCQPKSCAPVTCSPHTKQKQKKSYWSTITHVILDLIGNDLKNQVMTYLWFGIRMKHLLVWDWYTLSDFFSIFVGPSVSSKWSFGNEMLTSKISFMVMRKFHQHTLLPQ